MAKEFNPEIRVTTVEEFHKVKRSLEELPDDVMANVATVQYHSLADSIRLWMVVAGPNNELCIPSNCESISSIDEGLIFYCTRFTFYFNNPPVNYRIRFI